MGSNYLLTFAYPFDKGSNKRFNRDGIVVYLTNNRTTMKYLEFIFTTEPQGQTERDVLCAVLADAGFESFVEQDGGSLAAYVQADVFDKEALEAALRDFPLAGVRVAYTWSEAEDRDWNEEWEKHFFRPIVIGGGRCVVHSAFHEDVPQAEYDIVINPQMAFGTGHHETTGLMVEAILEADVRGRRVLDMGCGTSILAILARMRGAARCTAVDIDEWCVRNSLENIALNGVDGIDVRLGDAALLEGLGPFDVVIANINRNILLRDLPLYEARLAPGGSVLLSGFYADDIPLLCEAGGRCGLSLAGRREKNRWAMVEMRKP